MCSDGQCVGNEADAGYDGRSARVRYRYELGEPIPGCEPPEAYCDGEVAVSSPGFARNWGCTDGDPITCTFDEDRQNCSLLTGARCKDGRCIECERDDECKPSERCDARGACVDTPDCSELSD